MAGHVSSPQLDTSDVAAPGGIQWSPASPYAREITKFERAYTPYGPPGLPPYQYQPFPARLYKASRDLLGRAQYEGVTVGDVHEQRQYEARGYVAGGQGEALKALEAEEQEIAVLAANRVAQERRMSEQARAEAAQVDDATDAHVASIPEAAKGKKTREAPHAG